MHSSPVGRSGPERDVREHVEPEQEAELELDRDERRELEQPRVPDDLAEEDVARRGERQRARLGDRSAGAAHVGLVELERGAELDDRGRRVPDRGEPVADLVVRVARVDAPRVARGRTRGRAGSRRCSPRGSRRGGVRGAPRARGTRGARYPRAGSGGGVLALPTRCACLPRSCASYGLIFVGSRTNATLLPR